MRKLWLLLFSAVFMLPLACGDDDDDGNGPGPTPLPVVSAFSAAQAPSMSNPNDPLWANATAQTIDIPTGSALPSPGINRESRPISLAVADNINVQAIVFSDTLYMRIEWSDATHSVWPERWRVTQIVDGFPIFAQDGFVAEDQMAVLFQNPEINGYDVWHWRALTTGIAEIATDRVWGYAEGRNLIDTLFPSDIGTAIIALENDSTIAQTVPEWMHPDSSEFNGFILYQHVSVQTPTSPLPTGWTVGQFIPGKRIDTSIATPQKAQARGSKYDIEALSEWSDAADQWVVILKRALNTGTLDDMNLAAPDTVQVKIGITDNHNMSVTTGSSDQGFTGPFKLAL